MTRYYSSRVGHFYRLLPALQFVLLQLNSITMQKQHENEIQTTTARSRRSRNVLKVLAKFSRVFRSFRRFGDVFGPVRTFPGAFGHVRMRSEAFGSVRTFSEIFVLVPNTGEANEVRAPMALIISEMCALRLENNNRLRQ